MTARRGRASSTARRGASIPVDVGTIQETLNQAESALRESSPGTGQLADLEMLLRGHIEVLLPEAQAAVDALWHGSIEWSRGTGRLSGIRFQLRLGVGDSPLSARVQVERLCAHCQSLLDEHKARQL